MALTSASRDRTKPHLSAPSRLLCCSPRSYLSISHPFVHARSRFSLHRQRLPSFLSSLFAVFFCLHLPLIHTHIHTLTQVLMMSGVSEWALRLQYTVGVNEEDLSSPASLLLSSSPSFLSSSSSLRGNWILSMSIMRRCRRINR